MIQTRIYEWEEYSKPTVQIFSTYEEQKWISKQNRYEIHVTSREIYEYTVEEMNKWKKNREARVVWLGVNSNKSWEKILQYRNENNINIYFSFYLNSFIGLGKNISSMISQMTNEDTFVFNSPFAKDTFEKTISRNKDIVYCINSVSTVKVESNWSKGIGKVGKEEQICIFSRLNPYKNTHVLLETIRDSKWKGKVVVGLLPNKNNIGFYYEKYLKTIINESDINVIGMRAYNQKEINSIMSKSIACIVLSTSFEETQGKVIVEAAKNCCLPITNIWNGHQDYLPNSYMGNVSTRWDSIRGINIDKEDLAGAISNISSLYKADFEKYKYLCNEILSKIAKVSSEERSIMKSGNPGKYDYLDYVSHFGRIKIDKSAQRNCPPNPNFNIDYYIWKRKTCGLNSINENLKRDYECLKKHRRHHEYAPLLDLLVTECLFEHDWRSSNLLEIVELIESRKIYQEWTRQVRLLFKL